MLQKEKLPLWKFLHYLDVLTNSVTKEKERSCSLFSKITLGTKYIKIDNDLSTYPIFETGVAKIQQGFVYEEMMTLEKEVICKSLLNDNLDIHKTDSNDEENRHDFAKAVADGEKFNAREVSGKLKYIYCNFILGTVPCIERLWNE